MTVDSAFAWGADLASVGASKLLLLLEESQGGVGGLIKVGCEFWVQKDQAAGACRQRHGQRCERNRGLRKVMSTAGAGHRERTALKDIGSA
jgi:hypothetical protein